MTSRVPRLINASATWINVLGHPVLTAEQQDLIGDDGYVVTRELGNRYYPYSWKYKTLVIGNPYSKDDHSPPIVIRARDTRQNGFAHYRDLLVDALRNHVFMRLHLDPTDPTAIALAGHPPPAVEYDYHLVISASSYINVQWQYHDDDIHWDYCHTGTRYTWFSTPVELQIIAALRGPSKIEEVLASTAHTKQSLIDQRRVETGPRRCLIIVKPKPGDGMEMPVGSVNTFAYRVYADAKRRIEMTGAEIEEKTGEEVTVWSVLASEVGRARLAIARRGCRVAYESGLDRDVIAEGSFLTRSPVSLKERWIKTAEWRWAWAHATILDVCLGLTYLPMYVYLEIVDWISPVIARRQPLRKIRLIQAVYDAASRVRAKRKE